MADFAVVPIPTGDNTTGRGKHNALWNALVQARETNSGVALNITRLERGNIYNALAGRTEGKEVRVRSRTNGDAVVFWLESRT